MTGLKYHLYSPEFSGFFSKYLKFVSKYLEKCSKDATSEFVSFFKKS